MSDELPDFDTSQIQSGSDDECLETQLTRLKISEEAPQSSAALDSQLEGEENHALIKPKPQTFRRSLKKETSNKILISKVDQQTHNKLMSLDVMKTEFIDEITYRTEHG